MRPLQAHCHHGLGTLYATTGRRTGRCRTLTPVTLYRAVDMTFWLPRVETAMRGQARCLKRGVVYPSTGPLLSKTYT